MNKSASSEKYFSGGAEILTLEAMGDARYKFHCKAQQSRQRCLLEGRRYPVGLVVRPIASQRTAKSGCATVLCHGALLVEKWKRMLDFGVTLYRVFKDTCRG